MSDPLPPHPESVPPISDKASHVERESAHDAAARARGSDRIGGSGSDESCPTSRACEAIDRFVHKNPVLSVGLAFGLGLAVGAALCVVDD